MSFLHNCFGQGENETCILLTGAFEQRGRWQFVDSNWVLCIEAERHSSHMAESNCIFGSSRICVDGVELWDSGLYILKWGRVRDSGYLFERRTGTKQAIKTHGNGFERDLVLDDTPCYSWDSETGSQTSHRCQTFWTHQARRGRDMHPAPVHF